MGDKGCRYMRLSLNFVAVTISVRYSTRIKTFTQYNIIILLAGWPKQINELNHSRT